MEKKTKQLYKVKIYFFGELKGYLKNFDCKLTIQNTLNNEDFDLYDLKEIKSLKKWLPENYSFEIVNPETNKLIISL